MSENREYSKSESENPRKVQRSKTYALLSATNIVQAKK